MATPTNLPAAAVSGEILTASYVNNLRGAFRVLQVVQGVANLQLDNSTQTPTTTGLTATITPQSVTNKILVLVSQVSCLKTSGNSQSAITLLLLRGATTIQQFAQFGLYTDSLVQNRGNFSTVYLDSPATTSAVTYSTQFANAVTAASVSVCAGNGAQATITLIEISA
jgi:hypothetical protein